MLIQDGIVDRIIIDNFMPEEQLVYYNQMFYFMYDQAEFGTIARDHKIIADPGFKSRMEFDLRLADENNNTEFVDILAKNLWTEERKHLYSNHPVFAYMLESDSLGFLGAFYKQGDFYNEHADLSIVTAIFFHQDESSFEGGDLLISNSTDHTRKRPDKKWAHIAYKRNRLVIFPSRFTHMALPVHKSLVEGLDGNRLCTQIFMNLSTGP